MIYGDGIVDSIVNGIVTLELKEIFGEKHAKERLEAVAFHVLRIVSGN